jgi:hypothetical protein
VLAADPPLAGRRPVRVPQVRGADHQLGHGCADVLACHPFHDHAGENVPGVRVLPTLAGGEVRLAGQGDPDQLRRLDRLRQLGGVQRPGVVRQPAGVLQELAHRDVAAVDLASLAGAAHHTGQVGLDRRVEPNPVTGDQLQHGDRGKRLGDAGDPEAGVAVDHRPARTELGRTGRHRDRPAVPVTDLGQRPGDPVRAGQQVELGFDASGIGDRTALGGSRGG